jgi:hypothetical protein
MNTVFNLYSATRTASGNSSNSTTDLPEYTGFLFLVGSSLFYGSNFLPVKQVFNYLFLNSGCKMQVKHIHLQFCIYLSDFVRSFNTNNFTFAKLEIKSKFQKFQLVFRFVSGEYGKLKQNNTL